MFEMELERNAFVTTISNFAIPNAGGDLKYKNAEAIKTILDIALTEGNYLHTSWKDILSCIAQIEKFPQYGQQKGGSLDVPYIPEGGKDGKKRTGTR
jgi:brefeldin A-inhibited guanine nucleotide-exchange protein